MVTLRSYQQELISATRDSFKTDHRVILCAPTGSGKTVMFSFMANTAAHNGKRVLIVSSRSEILKQNARRLDFAPQFITPRHKLVPTGNLVVAMSQTLQRRIENVEWQEYIRSVDLLIIDEAHESYSNFIFQYLSDKCFVVGATATPHRSGNQVQLGDLYSRIVDGVQVKRLIFLGNIVPCKTYTFKAPSLEGIGTDYGTGDYIQKQLAHAFEQKEQYSGVVSNYLRICPHTKAIVFCVSSKQAISITQEFIDNGVKAKYILSGTFFTDASMSDKREQLLSDFENGEFDVLVNVGVLVAGFDCPSVQTVILAFATLSITKYLQALGRGSRPAPFKTHFNFLDFGGNYSRHGAYDANRKWSLWHEKRAGGGIPALKECPDCFRFIPTSTMKCPFCGHIFHTEKEIYEVELEEVVAGEEDESKMSIPQWCAHKKLQGWSTQRILVTAMIRAGANKKKAFEEARKVLRTEKGEMVSSSYYFFLKKHVKSLRDEK